MSAAFPGESHAPCRADRDPHRGGVALTWRECASRVRQIAAGLHRLGVGRGDAVAS